MGDIVYKYQHQFWSEWMRGVWRSKAINQNFTQVSPTCERKAFVNLVYHCVHRLDAGVALEFTIVHFCCCCCFVWEKCERRRRCPILCCQLIQEGNQKHKYSHKYKQRYNHKHKYKCIVPCLLQGNHIFEKRNTNKDTSVSVIMLLGICRLLI